MADIKSIGFTGGFFESESKLNFFGQKEKNIQGSLVFGRNGSGKSTITKLLRKFKESNLNMESSVKFYDKQLIDITESIDKNSIYIFDEDFIDNNIRFKTNDGLESIIMIGNQIEVEDEIERINEKIIELRASIANIDISIYDDLKNVLSPLYYDNSMLNILKADNGWARIDSNIKGNTNKSSVNPSVLNNLLEYENSKKLADLKAKFNNEYNYFDTIRNFSTTLTEFKPIIELKNSEQKLIKTLAEEIEKPIGDKWVDRLNSVSSKYGTNHVLNIASYFTLNKEYCPFCLRDMSEHDIEKVINAIRKQQNVDVELYRTDLDSCRNHFIENYDFEQYEIIPNNNSKNVRNLIIKYNEIIKTMNEAIDNRLNDIFKVIHFDNTKINIVINQLSSEIEILNNAVRQFNKDVDNSNTLRDKLIKLNNEIHYHLLKDLANQKKIQEEEKSSKIEIFNATNQLINEKTREINGLLDKQKNIDIAVDLLNRFLGLIFLSKDRLKIILEEGQYKILSNKKIVAKQNLSTGERNAIALCYFFSLINADMPINRLFTKDVKVFIDDPVSSFDIENRIGIFSFLKTVLGSIIKGNKNSKIVVFSHKIDVYLDMLKVYDDILLDTEFYYEHYRLENQKLNIMKSQNIYKILIRDIYKYALDGVDNDESMNIGNKMRRVLESFSTFNYGISFMQLTRQGMIESKIKKEDLRIYFTNFMQRLLLNNESHFEESIYSIETQNFYKYVDFNEKLVTAKSAICLLFLFDKVHVTSHIFDEKDEFFIFREKNTIEGNICQWIDSLI